MKRLLPVFILAVAGALFWFRAEWLPAASDHRAYLGYSEGDTVLVAATVTGRISAIAVKTGDTINAGGILFRIDDAAQQAEVVRLAAAVETARATAANLDTGKRQEEIDLIARQEAEAKANFELARIEYTRASSLSQRGVAAETQFDKAKANLSVAEERVKQMEAQAAIARLPARSGEREAARSRIGEAEAALAAARAKLADFHVAAATGGIADDIFFDAGEVVPAGQPVLSIRRPGAETLRFFIPEGERAKATVGTRVRYHCDGCGEGGEARITRVSTQPEYTPPVIYSASARAKLVFLVEAEPLQADPHLQPGLPIEVEPLP